MEPNGGGERAFVHVKAFASGERRPEEGALVSYEVERSNRGLVAKQVRRAGSIPRMEAPQVRTQLLPMPLIAAYAIALVVGWYVRLVPWTLPLAQGVLSFIAFLAYAADKAAAEKNGWRVPEGNLHLFALLGGWPGALIAQHAFRHKTSKRSFQLSFRVVVVLSVIAVAVLACSGAAMGLHTRLMGAAFG